MDTHTPKRDAVERFLESHKQHAQGWTIRVAEDKESPVLRLQASGPDASKAHATTLEIHTRQVTTEKEGLDESTEKMILRWLDSLTSERRP